MNKYKELSNDEVIRLFADEVYDLGVAKSHRLYNPKGIYEELVERLNIYESKEAYARLKKFIIKEFVDLFIMEQINKRSTANNNDINQQMIGYNQCLLDLKNNINK